MNLPNLYNDSQLKGILEKLDIHCQDQEYVLLPLTANVRTLHYKVEADDLHPEYFNALSITTKDLYLEIDLGITPLDWDYGVLVSLLNGVAQLGDFECLGLSANAWQ